MMSYSKIRDILPGLLLSIVVTLVAVGLENVEAHLAGRAWLEALVLAILLGTVVRSVFRPGPRFSKGITFSGKILLEIAVVLLGASISAGAVEEAGSGLILGIACVVAVSIAISYSLGRLLRLPHRMAVLVACGNSICGNSAIAAVALGGVSLAGGRGGLAGAAIGAIDIFLLQSLLTAFNVSTYVLQIAYGVILVAAVVMTAVQEKFAGGKARA